MDQSRPLMWLNLVLALAWSGYATVYILLRDPPAWMVWTGIAIPVLYLVIGWSYYRRSKKRTHTTSSDDPTP
ncbi:hypothetical protein [Nocardiopsis sp. JB363]|uniref:hypothetical protein n=1 Tax=Nocardiopsis sp. JB363 TaxID=1434837 RepID=UPI000979E958|nr:hypothetical protein [Nocardiopsis sp. JB363]SIO84385.1 hypothetical protein BQ8420_01620 [Nocardiopsis sp. JB363]